MSTVNLTEQMQGFISELKADGNTALKNEVISQLKAGGRRGRPKKVYTQEELEMIEYKKANPGKRGRPAKKLTQEEYDAQIAELQNRLV